MDLTTPGRKRAYRLTRRAREMSLGSQGELGSHAATYRGDVTRASRSFCRAELEGQLQALLGVRTGEAAAPMTVSHCPTFLTAPDTMSLKSA